MAKKGSMELGVNSIVILIIALVVLGLTIGFITRLINQTSDKVADVIENQEITNPATSSDPLTFEVGTLELKIGKDEFLKASVYNYLANELPDASIVLAGQCVDSDGFPTDAITVSSAPQTIKSGTFAGYKTVIKTLDIGVAPGTYICTLQVLHGSWEDYTASKQIFVKISP